MRQAMQRWRGKSVGVDVTFMHRRYKLGDSVYVTVELMAAANVVATEGRLELLCRQRITETMRTEVFRYNAEEAGQGIPPAPKPESTEGHRWTA